MHSIINISCNNSECGYFHSHKPPTYMYVVILYNPLHLDMTQASRTRLAHSSIVVPTQSGVNQQIQIHVLQKIESAYNKLFKMFLLFWCLHKFLSPGVTYCGFIPDLVNTIHPKVWDNREHLCHQYQIKLQF